MTRMTLLIALLVLTGCAGESNVGTSDTALNGQMTDTRGGRTLVSAVASRPVWVGRNEDRRAPACARRLQVRGETIAAHWSPDAAGPVKAQLSGEVLACDSAGAWTGVIFPGPGETLDYCALNRRIGRPTEYQGPCRSGWVRTAELAG